MSEYYAIEKEILVDIADATREKTGETNGILAEDIADKIREITGGIELPELTNEGSASDLLSGKELIDQEGNIVTGTITTKTSSDLTASGAIVTVPAGYYASQATKSVATTTQATPDISINSDGLITARTIQSTGYVTSGVKSATKQLTTQAAKTITPSKSSQTVVASGVYTTGEVTVKAIPSEYITTTDATADASEILNGETAYVNGSKIIGTFTIDEELIVQDDLITQIQTALSGKTAASGSVTLPTLSNPATAENLEEGYELIDADGNIVVGTHVCESGSGDEESITFSVINNLPDLISVYGKICPPNETTVVSVSSDASNVYGMPIAIWIGMIDGEQRNYYDDYSVYLSYPTEGDNGIYNEIFEIITMPQYYCPLCTLGITEVTPYGNECFTFYCEDKHFEEAT